MAMGNSTKRIRDDDLFVTAGDHPGWVSANERAFKVGDTVYCTGGEGVVVAVLGKTSDGSRLLEIRLSAEGARPFFAAASNVLVAAA
ncbi:MAG TPA: hypothetical protein VGC13_32425 [Longimicrobium sp.]|jgi:hypothetical protein|uniref:hypothetical protein n=1 Tax=Longimicrobium sp. TaxID=2029185 RepID=UPI002ED864CB